MNNREIHVLGAFVHGALTFGHLLGIVYNVRRGNRWDARAHTLGVLYDGWATYKHMKEVR